MKKRNVFLSGLLAASVILGACGSSSSTSSGENESNDSSGEKYVAVVSKGFQHQFWQSVKKGAEKAADEFDVKVTFEGPESESQIDKQIEMLKAAIEKKPDAIGFAALDSKASLSLLEDAKSKDIPVIAFDSGVESDIPLTTASTDNRAAAALAAEKMAEAIDGKGKIAIVAHDQTSLSATDRRDGFKEKIEKDFPDIEIVDIQYGGGDQLKSTDLAKTMMQAHSDLKGIFGTNEGSAIGVVNAAQEMNKKGKIVIVGFDSGKQQLDAIRDGLEYGAVTQNPVGIGYETVKAAVEATEGKELPKTIDTGFYWYDKDNIDSAEIKAAVYE